MVRPGSRKHGRASFWPLLVSTFLFCTDTGFVSLGFGSRKGFDEVGFLSDAVSLGGVTV